MNQDNTKRFSDRVADYIKYRPTYPDAMIRVLQHKMGLDKSAVIADIGSGTGISSLPFLNNGNFVFGVEPNNEMRTAQEQMLNTFPSFKSTNGTAESTTLESQSIDVIFCGQAYHWFDKEASKAEFARILKPGGHIVLAWNSRSTKTAFQQEYEQVLYDNIEDYKNVTHRDISEKEIEIFFSPKPINKDQLDNEQIFDVKGLKGRLKSSSYCPKEGEKHEKLMTAIEALFAKHQINNTIQFQYETQLFWC